MIPAPVKRTIPFDLLEQVDIRVGTIVAVDDLPKSKKLVRLRVNFGDHERTILAGAEAGTRESGGAEGPADIVRRQSRAEVGHG